MILSGCQNTDSGIGCYAGSHDSYTTFSDLFDKVIEDLLILNQLMNKLKS